MNKTVNTDYRDAKKALDVIFLINILCLQEINNIGAGDSDASQMHIMGAWSQLYMNLAWLQRLYDKAHLEDSQEVSMDIPLEGDRSADLKILAEHLETALLYMEQTDFQYLWVETENTPTRVFDLMLDNIYTGIYEAQALLDRDLDIEIALDDQHKPENQENHEADEQNK